MKRRLFGFALLALVAAPTWAASGCSTTIEGNDAMQFNQKSIVVPATCKQFTIELSCPRPPWGTTWWCPPPPTSRA